MRAKGTREEPWARGAGRGGARRERQHARTRGREGVCVILMQGGDEVGPVLQGGDEVGTVLIRGESLHQGDGIV